MVKAKELPETGMELKDLPESGMAEKELPKNGKEENIVVFGDEAVEIKPTKLLYMRNRTAEFYRILDTYPLPDILSTEKGMFGDNRDGDKCVLDWLIAVTDDEKLVRRHYNEIDAGTIDRLLEIFKRLNKIQEKEDKLKNLTTPGKVV